MTVQCPCRSAAVTEIEIFRDPYGRIIPILKTDCQHKTALVFKYHREGQLLTIVKTLSVYVIMKVCDRHKIVWHLRQTVKELPVRIETEPFQD
jgi:hypothetical protein